MKWTEKHQPPERKIKVLLNFGCNVRQTPHLMREAVAVKADVSDHAALVNLLRGAGCVVNSVQYYFNLPIMDACLDARVPYVDLGGLFHTTRKQLALDEKFTLSVRNLAGVRMLPSNRVTARDIMDTRKVVLTQAALEKLQDVLS